MTSTAADSFDFLDFSTGPAPAEGLPTFLEGTEVTLQRLHRNMHRVFGRLPSSVPDLPGQAEGGKLEPDNLLLILVLLATVAGALLVIFTGF